MNLFSFIRRGEAHADVLHKRQTERADTAIAVAVEKTRAEWLDALTIDATRAWMSVGEKDRHVLMGLVIMLTVSGFCLNRDGGDETHPDFRVFRGAISAATQCSAGGSVISVEHARAFHSAVSRAAEVIRGASGVAIIHAAESIRLAVGISDKKAPGPFPRASQSLPFALGAV